MSDCQPAHLDQRKALATRKPAVVLVVHGTAVERILTDTDTRHDPLPHHRAWCVRSGLLKRVHADSAQRRRPNYATCQTVLRFQSLLLYAGVVFNGVLARERRRHEH